MLPTSSGRPSADRCAVTVSAAASGPRPGSGRLAPCPVCGGVLFDMRGIHKCQRCAFAMCVGCDTTTEDECDE